MVLRGPPSYWWRRADRSQSFGIRRCRLLAIPFRRIFPEFWIRPVVVTRTHGNPLTRNLWPDLFVLLTRDVMVQPKNDSTRANNDEITSHCFDGRPLHQHRQISSCTKPCTKPSQSSGVGHAWMLTVLYPRIGGLTVSARKPRHSSLPAPWTIKELNDACLELERCPASASRCCLVIYFVVAVIYGA